MYYQGRVPVAQQYPSGVTVRSDGPWERAGGRRGVLSHVACRVNFGEEGLDVCIRIQSKGGIEATICGGTSKLSEGVCITATPTPPPTTTAAATSTRAIRSSSASASAAAATTAATTEINLILFHLNGGRDLLA